MRLSRACGLLVGMLLCGGIHAEVHRYTIELERSLSVMAVRACFASPAPKHLRTGWSQAAAVLDQPRLDDGRAVPTDGATLRLPSLGEARCLRYRVRLDAAQGERRRAKARRFEGGWYLSPKVWLWRPDALADDETLRLRFEHPPDIGVAAPWPLLERTAGRTVFEVGRGPRQWYARMAIGELTHRRIDADGGHLRVSLAPGMPLEARALGDWLKRYADALATVTGTLPRPSTAVMVLPTRSVRDPVPWAQVLRGGAPAIQLFLGADAQADELMADWTLPHELSHLLLPFVRRDDAWLSEGLASYYQNVLRARAGIMTPRQAWQAMHEGFERGRAGTDERSLAEVSGHAAGRADYRRVYWSGAAMLLLADWRLQRSTQGRWSLDRALKALGACCIPSAESWSAQRLLRRLDRITGKNVLSEVHSEYIDSHQFPNVSHAFEALGIDIADGDVRLREDAPDVDIRRAIMGVRKKKG